MKVSLKDEDSLYYKVASNLLGNESHSKEHTHHIPIGWLIMILVATFLGLVMGFGLNHLR